jgi:hypothetical protein
MFVAVAAFPAAVSPNDLPAAEWAGLLAVRYGDLAVCHLRDPLRCRMAVRGLRWTARVHRTGGGPGSGCSRSGSLRPRRRRRRRGRPRDSRTPAGTGLASDDGRKARVSDVEHAAGQCQHSGCGAGVGPHPRQREAAHAAEPDKQRASIVKAATATIVGYCAEDTPGGAGRPHPAARLSRGPVGGSCLGGSTATADARE